MLRYTITSPQISSDSEERKPNTRYAQTNLQLFNQLSSEGYSSKELKCIFSAYELATYLFTGSFRPSGKTFLAHLVGTASILVSLKVSGKIVAAGLLHSAYDRGGFGINGKKKITPAKRQKLICAVGSEVEEYIARYTALKWKEKNIPLIQQQLDSLELIDREVLLIRLANELEEYLDLGILYCGQLRQKQYANHDSHLIVEMAEKLGFPSLAAELATAQQEIVSVTIPKELSRNQERSFPFFIPPRRKKSLLGRLKNALRQLRF